jgi:alginate O-acetyltransferase complex protein AlgI
MIFSSTVFLFVYLPLTLAIYYLVPLRGRNLVLFLVSLLFYGWEEPAYILVMLASVTVAYVCGFPIGKYRETHRRRARGWLILSLSVNLGLLFFFKYANFFIENLARLPVLAGVLTPLEGVELPIGISFYTFQIMSYSIDLYRGETDTQRNYVSFGTYVALFPQLIAGPIVRYRDIDAQLAGRRHTVDKFAAGVRRFAVGFGKKILLGDTLAALYAYFGTAADFEATVLGGWMMVICYTLHIYFDFSGYSDMAIGLGRMLGFELPENFNYPYLASSVTDFWRRWHITLSSWFRAYVYIPLGGNRRGKARQYVNLAVVWLLTGLWHGASWNFVLWGVFYLVILVVEKAFLLSVFEKNRATRFLGHVWALLLVGIGWMLFDHTDLEAAAAVLASLWGAGTVGLTTSTINWQILHALPTLALGVAAATPYPARLWSALTARCKAAALAEPVLLFLLLVLSVACMVGGTYSPFLYFQF